jgi:transcriptional regulator with XRE-family HTH domain
MDSKDNQPQELRLDSAGARLRRAREAAGMSVQAVAEATRIPQRHVEALENDDFAALPARAYGVGFARSYVRAEGADEAAPVDAVREQLAASEPDLPRRAAQPFEPGDPARVPSARFAWISALFALAVIFAGFAFWRTYYEPGGELPSLLPSATPAPAASAAPAPAASASAAPAPGGPVVFTATAPQVWVKFYDGAGKQLMQKEMAQGESYTVPADTGQVLLWTARPDALAITIGGMAVPPLSDHEGIVKDVPVTAAALLARAAPAAPGTSPAPGIQPQPSASPAARPRAPRPTPSAASPTASPSSAAVNARAGAPTTAAADR